MNSPPKTGASESHQHEMDVAVMLRVQRDEAGAFGELINLWWSPLFGLFFRQFHDRQEAEDLVQDVFLHSFAIASVIALQLNLPPGSITSLEMSREMRSVREGAGRRQRCRYLKTPMTTS